MFPLAEGDWSVGRLAGNALFLDDSGVSRHHCVFHCEGPRCFVRDLDSHNGTLVNGESIREQALEDGDQIRIGASTFLFLSLPAAGEGAPAAGPEPKTTELRLEDSIYMSSAEFMPMEPSARATQDLRTLLRVGNLLHSMRDLRASGDSSTHDNLGRQLSTLLLELIPAERAAVFGLDPTTGPFRPIATAFARALIEKVAVWLDDADSIGRSVLAAPLLVRGEVAAIVYLDGERTFDQGHLEFLTAVASMAAIAWENAELLSWLEQENERLQEDLDLVHDMVGTSDKIRDLQRQIAKVAPSGSTVLILGESGTGKELIARALHRNSPRSARPFMAINCAALTESLLESELFGHEKGAFTGAVAQKRGKLETANGGTVFLDEIGELPLSLQAKLLRALQQREIERVGGTQTVKLDIRVVAASNRDLEESAKKGEFRQDLFYRLNVVTLKAPPLRNHPEDILPLAEHFAKKYAEQCGRRITGLAPQTRAWLQSYSWPGNVRELENAIERAMVLGSSDQILPEDLPEHIRESRPADVTVGLYEEAVEAAKRQVVIRAFEQTAYDHEQAAHLLGLHPNYLHRLIRALDLRPTIKRAGK